MTIEEIYNNLELLKVVCDFNDALKAGLMNMRLKAMKASDAVASIHPMTDIN